MGEPFPGPFGFKNHPWLEQMHDDENDFCIGQKSAQMGFTEWALNRVFFKMDVEKTDCLYVLPAKTPDASDFSASRFDPALELSQYLKRMFSDVKNIGHKRAGANNLYIRGSRSRSGLKSIPTGFIVLDEVDEMTQENIPLAFERASGQLKKQILMLSTPTIHDVGINEYYMKKSDRKHFLFKCPCCSKWTELIFPECLVITAETLDDINIKYSFYQCKECKGRLDHRDKSNFLSNWEWVPEITDVDGSGYYINQMYSTAQAGEPAEMGKAFLLGQTNVAAEQEFFNSKLGLPHIPDGSKLTLELINKARKGFSSDYKITSDMFITMGIDVGKWIHVVVYEWKIPNHVVVDLNAESHVKVLRATKVKTFAELNDLMKQYGPNMTVIDANPETRASMEFAREYESFVKLCYYSSNQNSAREIAESQQEPTITVDRTSWLDMTLGRYKSNRIELPVDISQEFISNLQAPTRIYEDDRHGNKIAVYKNSKPDHYAHASNYAEMALPLGTGFGTISIDSPI